MQQPDFMLIFITDNISFLMVKAMISSLQLYQQNRFVTSIPLSVLSGFLVWMILHEIES